MPLSDTTIRNAKPGERPIRLYDAGGLYLEIAPSGGKWWRLKYRITGKEKRISLGVYPEVSLKEAREKRDIARKQLASDIDPGEHRKAVKLANVEDGSSGFESIAREWFIKFAPNWVATHSDKIIRRLERDVFPWIGKRPIEEITAPEILVVMRRVEERGALETAHRALQNCSQIFRYSIATGRATRDPAADLRGALPPAKAKHHASITDPKLIGALLRAIKGYEGSLVTKCALQIAPLTFVRPGELRKAEWCEFNFDEAEWRIPAERMKMREKHIVPLSAQALVYLKELHNLTGHGKYVFPGARTNGRPMSENTVNAGLRRLGYSNDEMTGHGFRSMASTLLNEQGWNRDAIERQLAHAERDSIRAAYNYAEHLPERRRMMQAWADFLDGLVAARPS
ncbi:tyrosine-type recombinase/integrase [Undibacterium sp. RTI2.1]|uniref:tyrosine-type recombinase/integrase n=1 Tax=unclassified Undibacterium TaxID=2630295 RepID=UPI002B230BC5|nr:MULTISPECIES: integrase arm-type DNA-binding domain-containing protein [unclassified Undibacterium]MEB0030196.1 tyrosine-type recombinase/integrase [Undibacterium sp. RTI2.1]MEB0116820.1 tyrosine-type recombinase/integrase [Undibacterium sp. RTI2.2]